jgi:serine/threonine protein kinase
MRTAVLPADTRCNRQVISGPLPTGWENLAVGAPSLEDLDWSANWLLGAAPSPVESRRPFPDLAVPPHVQLNAYDALGQVSSIPDDVGSSTVLAGLPPSRHAAEAVPARGQAVLVPVKGWPRLAGYEVLGELGRGGMGIVYKAQQLRPQRLVAVKVIDQSLAGDSDTVARFRREQFLATRLTHPNLVAAYDAGQVEGLPYLVMEFLEGVGLDRLVEQRGSLPLPEACEVARQAALGLQHIHEHGLVHRDVKPSNLMLTTSGQVKVLDLGLTRLLNPSVEGGQITSRGQFLGTLDYVAPEQCEDSHEVDIRADIYSLGCTLYHLLAGHPPFAAPTYSSVFQKLKAHAETLAPPIREHRPEVPEPLTRALERMLAKDRKDRFVSPAEVVATLQPFSAGADLVGLLSAKPPSAAVAA